jgi:hypothetical protein
MVRLPAREVRARLQFDVERLRAAAHRLEDVDVALRELRARLEARAAHLADDAKANAIDDGVHIRRSQAHATAHLAKRAALGEVLRSSSPVALIAAMAASRWVGALKQLSNEKKSETTIKAHIEAGRVAHRLLGVMRPKGGIRSGAGQLTSAVVVAELAHPQNLVFVEEQIEEGLDRARSARGVWNVEDAIEAASRALRTAAELLESMADRAEPAACALVQEANAVEEKIASNLAAASSDRPGSRN